MTLGHQENDLTLKSPVITDKDSKPNLLLFWLGGQ